MRILANFPICLLPVFGIIALFPDTGPGSILPQAADGTWLWTATGLFKAAVRPCIYVVVAVGLILLLYRNPLAYARRLGD